MIDVEVLERLCREHKVAPGASEEELLAAERRLQAPLPEELRQLLRSCNGGQLWPDGDYPCRLLSAAEIDWASNVAYGEPGPPGLLAFLKFGADVVAVQADASSAYAGVVVDCFHETFPHEIYGIAESIGAALRLVVCSDNEEWIWPAARAFGVDYAQA